MNGFVVPQQHVYIPEAFQEVLPVNPRSEPEAAAAIGDALELVQPPELSRLKSIRDKAEKGSRQTKVHRSHRIVSALSEVFHEDWLTSRSFNLWLEAATTALISAPKDLANHPFMRLPASVAVAKALDPKSDTIPWTELAGIVWGVWYCSEQDRLEYLVKLGSEIRRGPRDELFDSPSLGRFLDETAKVSLGSWGGGDACIWVVDDLGVAEPKFYSHFCMLGRFHHSSFLSGSGIAAGGEWWVTDGHLNYISGASGHYQPELWRLIKALHHLNRKGAIRQDTVVRLYYRGELKEVNALEVLKNPKTYVAPDWLPFG